MFFSRSLKIITYSLAVILLISFGCIIFFIVYDENSYVSSSLPLIEIKLNQDGEIVKLSSGILKDEEWVLHGETFEINNEMDSFVYIYYINGEAVFSDNSTYSHGDITNVPISMLVLPFSERRQKLYLELENRKL